MIAAKLRVHVTQEDIDAPEFDPVCTAETCMLASAITRAIGVAVSVSGYSDGTAWAVFIDGAVIPLPRSAGNRGADWDLEPTDVGPFSFTLRVSERQLALMRPDVADTVRYYGRRAPLLALSEAA